MRPEDILALYSHNSLRTIARVRGYAMGSLRRPELIVALAERLLAPDELKRAIDELAANETALLQTMADAGGRVGRDELAGRLLERGVIDQAGPPRARETIDRIAPMTRRFDELCARLTAHGLLFSEPHADGTLAGFYDLSPGEVLFLPGPVYEQMRLRSRSVSVENVAAPPAERAIRGRLLVQPSYSVLLLPPIDEPSLARLREIAEPVQIAEVAEFRLTQAALYAAVERGDTVENAITWLETRSDAPLPQNVRYTIDTWGRAFDQVRLLRRAALLEGDAAALDRIQADEGIAPLVLRRLDATRLLLRDADAAQQALIHADEIPHVTTYGTAAGPRVDLASDGLITLRDCDLLLPIELRRIAEPLDDGRWQIVADRVRVAVAALPDGLTGVLKWLRSRSALVPPEVVTRLRAWSLPPNAIGWEQPLLLHLPPELLADLRALPELDVLLADEYRPSSTAVRIAPEDRDRLVAALRSRGIELDARGE